MKLDNETENKHTPTPWIVDPGTVTIHAQNPINGSCIASVLGTGDEDSDQVSLADAEFIVRACNSHEALLEAAKRAYTHISLTIGLVSNKTREEKELLQMIHLAIAQAEARQ